MRSTTSVEVARTPEDVTASWLSRVLGAPVEEVTIAAVGTGQMGSLVRATITPADAIASDLPTSVIVKQAARLDDVRQLCGTLGIYSSEVRFFKQIASPRGGLPVPRCWFAEMDQDTDWFAIVMEDLGERADPGNQAAAASPERAATALIALAQLQAELWNDGSLLELDWLAPSRSEPLLTAAASSTEAFLARFGHGLDTRQAGVFERVLPRLAQWAGSWSGPLTVSHGDFRPDNIMFGRPGTGTPPVLIVDWQTVRLGPPLVDVAYFVGACLPTEDRAALERSLVSRYHDELRARGIKDYSFDQCWEDYRRGAIYGLVMAALGVQATPSERGDAVIVEGSRRYAEQVLQLDAESLLP